MSRRGIRKPARKAIWATLIVAIIALFASRQLVKVLQPEEITQAPVNTRLEYQIRDLDMRLLNRDGQVELQLQSPLLSRAGNGGPLNLQEPKVLGTDVRANWQAEALQGILHRQTDQIEMLGEVRLNHTQDGHQTHMATETLQLNSKTHLATTEDAVTINRSGSVLQGDGMIAELDTNQYELKNNVQAQFPPKLSSK